MRLVIESVLQGDLAPMHGCALLNLKNRFLKAHDFQVLLRSYPHLLPEQADEMLLRVPDLVTELPQAEPVRSACDAGHGIFDTSGRGLGRERIPCLTKQKSFDQQEHAVDG